MTLTDHNEVVLRVLRQNAATNPGLHPVRCTQAPAYVKAVHVPRMQRKYTHVKVKIRVLQRRSNQFALQRMRHINRRRTLATRACTCQSTALCAGACSWTGRMTRALLRCCRPLRAGRRESMRIGICSRRVNELWRASLGASSSRVELDKHLHCCIVVVVSAMSSQTPGACTWQRALYVPALSFLQPQPMQNIPKISPSQHTTDDTSHAGAQGYDLVLGSDVCYSIKALPALFAAAARLLARRPGAEFWLGYVSRCAPCNIHTRLLTRLVDTGLFTQ